MLRAFYSSATGMRAQELLIDNTANNIANVNTNGFKRTQLDFADLMYTTIRPPGADAGAGQLTPTGLQIGSGVRPVGTTKVFAQGVTQETGNQTDLAIEGDGFFKVTLPNGQERFTRDGAFRVDANGQIVNGDGYLLQPGFTLPSGTSLSQLAIMPNGTVSISTPQGTASAGNIQLYRFVNPAGLSNEGSNLYAESGASGSAQVGTLGTDVGAIRQGFLERSNVEVVNEMVALITAQRAYEINSRAIRAGDEMLSTTSQIVR